MSEQLSLQPEGHLSMFQNRSSVISSQGLNQALYVRSDLTLLKMRTHDSFGS